MERMYAFMDEYGAFGWDIDNPSVSTHFIITAIIVKESDLEKFEAEAEKLRRKHFQTGEIKSQKVGSDHARRQKVLADMMDLPYCIFSVCINKKDCLDNMNSKGLYYKPIFYKFMNNIVHRELRKAFEVITIIADEFGSNDYMQSFCKYVDKHQDLPNLWGDTCFSFKNSKATVGIQIADFISGTLAWVYDTHKKSQHKDIPNYYQILLPKLTRVEIYPKTYNNYLIDESAVAEDYDADIAKLCFAQAVTFIEHHINDEDEEIQAQIIVLKYLLFRFMNNDTRGYVYTSELQEQLSHTTIHSISTTSFRMRIIGKLRDHGVIIASSSKGYKIPAKRSELYDFINHDASIVIPMLSRLKKCRDIVKLGTANELDLLDHTEYQSLKKYFDELPINEG